MKQYIAAALLIGIPSPAVLNTTAPAFERASFSASSKDEWQAVGRETLPTNERTEASSEIVLEAEGLRIVDDRTESTTLSFGLSQASTTDALVAIAGKPNSEGINEECGAGRLAYAEWNGELTVWFQEGRFAGWKSEGGLTTADGIGL